MDTPVVPPPVVSPVLVNADLHCVGCQYNLRTRPVTDRCPECGRAIADTIEHQTRFAGAILEPATLRLAAYCFGVPSLLSIAAYVGVYLFRNFENAGGGAGGVTQVDLLLEYIGHILFVASLLMGVVLLGGSVSTIVAAPSTRVMLALMAGAYGIVNVLLSLGAFFGLMLGRGRPLPIWAAMTVLREQRVGTALLCLIMSLTGFGIMRNLSQALASERLRSLTRLAFGAMIICAGGTLAAMLAAGTWIPRRNLGQYDTLLNVLDIVSAVVYVGFGLYWLVVAQTVRQRTKPAGEVLVAGGDGALPVEQKLDAFLGRRPPGHADGHRNRQD